MVGRVVRGGAWKRIRHFRTGGVSVRMEASSPSIRAHASLVGFYLASIFIVEQERPGRGKHYVQCMAVQDRDRTSVYW